MNYVIIFSEDVTVHWENMSMVEYKRYVSSYEAEVLKVFTESFVGYPLFWGAFEDRFKSEIKDLVIPLVRSSGGNLITVTTNSEKNVDFYTNNGFTLIKEETLEYKAKTIKNWSFRMDLEDKE